MKYRKWRKEKNQWYEQPRHIKKKLQIKENLIEFYAWQICLLQPELFPFDQNLCQNDAVKKKNEKTLYVQKVYVSHLVWQINKW